MGFRFQLYRRSDFDKPPGVEWAVQRLLVRRGISLVYGEPKTGKSLLMQSVACVAAADYDNEADRLWCGYKVAKMKILYVAAEGFSGLMGRHDCFEEINGVRINNDNFRYLQRPINYFKDDSDWTQAAQDLKAQDFCPDYIFTDTLARSVLGGDERSEKDMAKAFTNAEGFCWEMKRAGMCFIGHATKDGRSYRGSPAIFAMVDGLSEVTRNGLAITWTCKDFKDAEPFEPVTVRCESAEVDTEMGPQKMVQIKTGAKGTAQRPGKEVKRDMDMEDLEVALRVMGNSATSGEWRARMRTDFGWGDTKFDDKLREFKNRRPELTGGPQEGGQGHPYSLGIQPMGHVAERMRKLMNGANYPAPTTPPALYTIESGAVRGGLECPEVPRSTPPGVERGGSSQGSETPNTTADELARLKNQL
jgi:hypothetical protein